MATISNQYYKQTKYIKEICFTNSLLNEPKTPARSKAITRQIIVQEKSKKDDEYILKKMVIFDNDPSVISIGYEELKNAPTISERTRSHNKSNLPLKST